MRRTTGRILTGLALIALVARCANPLGSRSHRDPTFHPGVPPARFAATLIAPATGSIDGQTPVSIVGAGFSDGATATVGGLGCGSPTVVSPTLLTCLTPSHAAGAADVVVTHADGRTSTLAGAFAFTSGPVVLSISPSGGTAAGGTALVIRGQNFATGATVALAGVACGSPSVPSSTQMTCTTGAHAAGQVGVTVSNPGPVVGTLANAFAYGGADAWYATATGSAPSARNAHTAIWTGSVMVVWGGSASGTATSTGGRYDPAADSWAPTTGTSVPAARFFHTAVWTGSRLVVWGGLDGSGSLGSGGRYDPVGDAWAATASAGAPGARFGHTAVWDDVHARMIVWGGTIAGGPTGGGARYDPVGDSWSATATSGAPSPRSAHSAVWAGTRMIVWGGRSDDASGGRYDPASDTWSATAAIDAPSARSGHVAAWTGFQMLVWGGLAGTTYLSTGGRYDPVADLWTPMAATGAPAARAEHTAVFDGSRLIVWGGTDGAADLGSGALYDPIADAWGATTSTGAPGARSLHSAVWAGTTMIVWGGGAYLATGGRYVPK